MRWTTDLVEGEKRAIKHELDSLSTNLEAAHKLNYILSKLTDLESDRTDVGLLRQFIYTVSALIHHVHFGGLTDAQVKRLESLGSTVLTVEGVKPSKSLLAYLHGELHLALSQVYRRKGDQWLAAWEQMLCQHLSGRNPPGGKALQTLSAAIRSQRLGHMEQAISLFQQAVNADLAPRATVRGQLGLIRSLRLAGFLSKSQELVQSLLKHKDLTDEETLELQWELTLREVMVEGDITNLLLMTKKGRPHFLASYVLEGFLWAKSVAPLKWEKRLPKISYLSRDKGLRLHHHGILYEACRTIENCYDTNIPMAVRLRQLGQILARNREFLSFEAELLFQTASARFLSRGYVFSFASLVLAEYKKASISASCGSHADILGVSSDLLQKSWFVSSGSEDEQTDDGGNTTSSAS